MGQSWDLPFCLWTCSNRSHASSVDAPTELKAAILNRTPFSHLLGTLTPLCLSLSCSLCLEIPSPAQACIQNHCLKGSHELPVRQNQPIQHPALMCLAHLYCSSSHIILTSSTKQGLYLIQRWQTDCATMCQLWSISRGCLECSV